MFVNRYKISANNSFTIGLGSPYIMCDKHLKVIVDTVNIISIVYH